MTRVITYFFAAGLGLSVSAFTPPRPQEPAPKKSVATAQIFSGTVTKLTDEAVTVVRKVIGHDAVTREFARDAATRVEGKLREGARVTVRYKPGEDSGFVALYIIVR